MEDYIDIILATTFVLKIIKFLYLYIHSKISIHFIYNVNISLLSIKAELILKYF
jgi:hypothetical protein